MLTIEYISTGRAYSDFEVEKKAKEIIDTQLEYLDQNMIYRTSTESLIEAIRLYIIESRTNPEGWLQFKCGDEIMSINKYGNPDHWAKGLFSTDRLRRIVKGQMAMRKEEKELSEAPIITTEENQ